MDNNRIGQLLSTAQFYGKILKKIFCGGVGRGKCVLDNNRGEFSLCLHLRWSDCQRGRAAMRKYVRSSKVGIVLRITTPQDGETDLGRSGGTGNCACDNN